MNLSDFEYGNTVKIGKGVSLLGLNIVMIRTLMVMDKVSVKHRVPVVIVSGTEVFNGLYPFGYCLLFKIQIKDRQVLEDIYMDVSRMLSPSGEYSSKYKIELGVGNYIKIGYVHKEFRELIDGL